MHKVRGALLRKDMAPAEGDHQKVAASLSVRRGKSEGSPTGFSLKLNGSLSGRSGQVASEKRQQEGCQGGRPEDGKRGERAQQTSE